MLKNALYTISMGMVMLSVTAMQRPTNGGPNTLSKNLGAPLTNRNDSNEIQELLATASQTQFKMVCANFDIQAILACRHDRPLSLNETLELEEQYEQNQRTIANYMQYITVLVKEAFNNN